MRHLCFVLSLWACSAGTAYAKVHWLFYAGAGVPYGSVGTSGYTDNRDYRAYDDFKLTPTGGLNVVVPIGSRFTVEAGLQYSLKGFRGKEDISFISNNAPAVATFDTRYRLHYISIPLTFNWTFLHFRDHSFQLGAGMTYAFLLWGNWNSYSIFNNGSPNETKSMPVKKGFVQTSNTSHGTFNIFDTGLRLQLSYTWRSRIMLRLFHEHSLYSLYLREPVRATSAKLRYTGISLGIIIPGAKSR